VDRGLSASQTPHRAADAGELGARARGRACAESRGRNGRGDPGAPDGHRGRERRRGGTDREDGKVVCFFQSAPKFKARHATLGFSDKASLDEGAMWPTSFALKELTAAEEATIVALGKKAAS